MYLKSMNLLPSFVLLTLVFTQVFSEAEARDLSWNDCVRLVAENNPELNAARENLNSSRELTSATQSGFLPSLSASVNANHEIDTFKTGTLYSSSLTLDYNLFSGFKDLATHTKAKSTEAISEAQLDSVRADVSNNLRQAFIKLKYAEANVKLTLQIMESRAQNERLVRAQYESGRENQGSYLLSQSTLEQAKFDHLLATHDVISVQESLAHIIGEEASDLSVSGNLPAEAPPLDPPLKELVLQSPTHRIQEGQVNIATSNSEIARAGFLPTLDFVASLQNQDHLLYTDQNQHWTVGLSLTLPLFNGLSTLHTTRSALQLERSALHSKFNSDFITYELLRQTLFAFQEADQKLKVNQISLRALDVQEKIARKQYNNGLMSFENWDIIEGNYISAQKAELASGRDRAISESKWRNAQGLGDLP